MQIEERVCTIFENLFSKKPNFITIGKALERIKSGKSKERVENIRLEIDKERRSELKKMLPSVCFSGKFQERKDELLKDHTCIITLDFDHVEDISELKSELGGKEYIYAFWTSPSGDGIKALALIADPEKHREHYRALKEELPNLDIQNINQARVCFESYDPGLYINKDPKPFTKIVSEVKVVETKILSETNQVIRNILTWLSNRGDAFVTGERNSFIYKFGGACSRYGIDLEDCKNFAYNEFFSLDNTFSTKEGERALESAYRSKKNTFGSASFEKNILVDKKTKIEIDINEEIPADGKPKDVIFGEDVIDDVLELYNNGFEKVMGIGVDELDNHYKPKRKEITLLTGYGNQGKSTMFKWYFLMRAILYGEKFCFFSPEDAPAAEFYFDCSEMLHACTLTPNNKARPSHDLLIKSHEFISKHFFFVYPNEASPTPEYIKERFLQTIITQKVDGVIIDPFNQLANDYSQSLGRDKYLETFLSSYAKFARDNNVFAYIVAHPKTPKAKNKDGNYDCPEVFDVADGSMWSNKMDNILIYHRPESWTDPESTLCEFHAKKIRRQKIVGKRGYFSFTYDRKKRRFYFGNRDPMEEALREANTGYGYSIMQPDIKPDIEGFNKGRRLTKDEIEQIPF